MGRTNPTYRDYLRTLESEWQPFRRALRRQYQAEFDRLFDRARDHADAAGYANGTDPEFAFLLSVLLAQEVELRDLRGRLDERDGDGDARAGTGTGRRGPDPEADRTAPRD